MATVKKPVKSIFNVSFRIVADLGKDIEASSLESALETARTYKLNDIIDLSEVDHNDSETPDITGVYRKDI